MKKLMIVFAMVLTMSFTTAVALCVRVLSGAQAVAATDGGGMRIVLDAGHGGIDGGVTGKTTGVKESDLNLAITHCLKDALEELGFEVTLTRKTEAGLYGTTAKGFKKRDMQKRKEIIEKVSPALVISIHQNFYPTSVSRGGQVFYAKDDARSLRLATALQEQINALYFDEGVKGRKQTAGEFFMLDCTSHPAALVECGFLSNAKDERLLTNAQWQKKLAHTLAVGVLQYFSGATT